jgi:hypothetical protein
MRGFKLCRVPAFDTPRTSAYMSFPLRSRKSYQLLSVVNPNKDTRQTFTIQGTRQSQFIGRIFPVSLLPCAPTWQSVCRVSKHCLPCLCCTQATPIPIVICVLGCLTRFQNWKFNHQSAFSSINLTLLMFPKYIKSGEAVVRLIGLTDSHHNTYNFLW